MQIIKAENIFMTTYIIVYLQVISQFLYIKLLDVNQSHIDKPDQCKCQLFIIMIRKINDNLKSYLKIILQTSTMKLL